MALNQYTIWTRGDYKSILRRELMDPTIGTGSDGRWFKDSDLNYWLDSWVQEIQEEFEFQWAVSTLTIGTVTSTITTTVGTRTTTNPPQLVISTSTFTPAMLRNEAVYYNSFRLAGRLLQDLEVGNPVWRGDLGLGTSSPSDTNPYVYDTPRAAVMYPDSQSILIWPCPPPPNTIPAGSGTNSNIFVFEYPVLLSFATDTSVSGLPVWTQYSARPYVCWKLFQRPGPLNDTRKAQRYKAQYERAKLRVRRMWDNFLPERYRKLQPGQHYEWEILTPPPAFDCGTNTATDAVGPFTQYIIPSNLGPGVTIPVFPSPHSVQIYRNGVLQMDQGVDYVLSGTNVNFTFDPLPTDTIIAVVT